MNRPNELERDLVTWMEAVAPRSAPEHLVQSVADRTRSMRPRPAWLARIQESPMQTRSHVETPPLFRLPVRIILVALLMLALVVGAIAAGSVLLRQAEVPPPFGIAGNGAIALDIGGTITFVSADGSARVPLELPYGRLLGQSLSRDGSRFAAWATPSDAPTDSQLTLVVANADGTGATDVDATARFHSPGARMSWSGDGRQVAFSANGDNLYVANVDERTISMLGDAVTRRVEPSWSPDGRLAYRCQHPDNGDFIQLCVMNGDGTDEAVLPTTRGTLHAYQGSVWSPDGRSIAYYIDDVDGTGGWDIAVFNLVTATEVVLTRDTDDHTIYPNWTPDGQHIVFLTGEGPGIVGVDGSALRIFRGVECNGLVEPSPDGRFFACAKGQDLAIWPIGGGEPTVIPLGGEAETVSWQRVMP